MIPWRMSPRYKMYFAEYILSKGGDLKNERIVLKCKLWMARCAVFIIMCYLTHMHMSGAIASHRWYVLIVVACQVMIFMVAMYADRKALCWKADEYALYKAKHEKEG